MSHLVANGIDIGSLDQLPQTSLTVSWDGSVAMTHEDHGQHFQSGDLLQYSFNGLGNEAKVDLVKAGTAARDNRELTKEEKLQHRDEINKQKLSEIKGLIDLQCFKRQLRKHSRNIVDARWVITWKNKPEGRTV